MTSFGPVSAAPVSAQFGFPALVASGALAAAESVLTGDVGVPLSADGVLVAQDAFVDGSLERIIVSASGALQAQPATMTGAADVTITVSGTLAAPAATLTGDAKALLSIGATLQAQDAGVFGVVGRIEAGGVLAAGDAAVTGASRLIVQLSGSLTSAAATIQGEILRRLKASGALTAAAAVMDGRVLRVRVSTTGRNALDLATAGNLVTITPAPGNSVEVHEMDDFIIKQGDTNPQIQATLKNPDGTVVDLTGINGIVFSMRDRSGAVQIDKTTATVVNASGGVVKYDWQTSDTNTSGAFYAEFQVTFGSGKIETFPNNGYIPVTITPEIA